MLVKYNVSKIKTKDKANVIILSKYLREYLNNQSVWIEIHTDANFFI